MRVESKFMILFFSSPIGLGHITRDIAIINKIMELYKYNNFEFITGSTAFEFISNLNGSAYNNRLSIYNLYNPPDFSITKGKLNNGFLWLLKYLYYYRNCKRQLKGFFNQGKNIDTKKCNNYIDLIISDEDLASLSSPESNKYKKIFITDILKTKFSNFFVFSKIEEKLNSQMYKIIKDSDLVIIPETGHDHDNFFYVGPIVREIFKTRIELRKKLSFEKKTILVSPGGTTAGSFLLKKTIESFLRLKNNNDYDLVIISNKNIQLPKLNENCRYIGLQNNGHEYIYASDLIISLAGKSTIDESMVYGTPGIFIPIKNHFEQEQRAKLLGFKYNDIHNMDKILETAISNEINNRLKKVENGVLKAAQIIYQVLNN
jgi:UDP-N-acetylglucosamine--N-acetylmuramyl-(pentapeptide) pyrophosphoryl-undecaprenol N-acetylglucosamine transferase